MTLAKQLIDDGQAGQDLPLPGQLPAGLDDLGRPAAGRNGLWRLDVAAAGSGVTGDLLAHCIDTALWLNGSIDSVCAMTETFIKERKHNLTGKVEPVGIDDACAFLCRFDNGSLGLFEVDPVRSRPQGPVHLRGQRREGVAQVGPAGPAPARVLRSRR